MNYDGFDGGKDIFPDMITVTEKIERYIKEKHGGRVDGAIGSSLGSSFVGQLVQRENIHIDHAIFGSPESIKNEYYTDLLTYLNEDINVEHTKAHFIYTNKMGEKYLKRYKKYFHDPDIREFDMQHEQWVFGGEEYARPVLKVIDEFMEMPV